jgi:hypothetical protein
VELRQTEIKNGTVSKEHSETLLALVTLIGLANSAVTVRAQARTPPYLNQFPTTG